MSIIVNKEMFRAKKLQKGAVKNRGKYLYWINLWGFGVIITSTVKGLKYDLSLDC